MQIEHRPGTWLDGDTGLAANHQALLKDMAGKRVVLLGETHDRYDIHRWQLHVIAALHALREQVVVGFEMFPRRVQSALDRWVEGEVSTTDFLSASEWKTVWGFPAELYLPIFNYCRQFKLPMKALNCRRALVTEVGKLGWDAVPVSDRDGLTPALPASAAYRQYLFDITGGARPERPAKDAQDADFDRFVRAQQTWDRAFACNIAHALEERPDALVVGVIGRGHLEYGHGTPWQLGDLGIEDVAVLLPEEEPSFDITRRRGIANAVFRLDTNDRAA
ncbi:ChaN family lipoprotein [Rhizobium sp. 18065]|uniref:ChaN family lipoprotein n=1 Tax=Rhizobium sp. 18065 TaxID=2681411 RepID=UPI00135CA3E2|nr:ChaN family lipoprotein [Rhizobium sp. 18065]